MPEKLLSADVWLILARRTHWRGLHSPGDLYVAAARQDRPTLNPGERAVRARITVPVSVFIEPELAVDMFVAPEETIAPPVNMYPTTPEGEE